MFHVHGIYVKGWEGLYLPHLKNYVEHLFLKHLIRAGWVPGSVFGTGNSEMIECVVPALRGSCSPGGARSFMFLNVAFHGSQAPEALRDCSVNNLDVIEERLYEGNGFAVSLDG